MNERTGWPKLFSKKEPNGEISPRIPSPHWAPVSLSSSPSGLLELACSWTSESNLFSSRLMPVQPGWSLGSSAAAAAAAALGKSPAPTRTALQLLPMAPSPAWFGRSACTSSYAPLRSSYEYLRRRTEDDARKSS